MSKIHIVMAFNEAYAMPACVAIYSAVHSALPDTVYKFHVLSRNELSNLAKENLRKAVNLSINSLDFVVLDNRLDSIPVTNNLSIEIYMRLILTDIFPRMDKCIYLDADIIVMGDLSNMWSYPMGESYIAGVYDFIGKKRYKDLNLPSYRHYINAGITVMNLSAIRADNLAQTFIDMTNKKYEFADQDILNKVCYGRITLLPIKYNMLFSWFINHNDEYFSMFSSEEIREAFENPVIIHFTDTRKPWNTNCLYAKMYYFWYKFARESPYSYDVEIRQTNNKGLLQDTKENYNRLLNSIEYKVGNLIFFIPRRIFRFARRMIRKTRGVKS